MQKKRDDSNSSAIESSDESSVDYYKPEAKKCFILHGKPYHTTDHCKYLKAMVKNKRK